MSQRGYAVAYDDLLVCFSSYPDPTPPDVISEAARVTAALGASACAVAGHIKIPLKSNQLAEMLMHLSDVARDEEAKSLRNAQSVMKGFQSAAESFGLTATTKIIPAELHTMIDRLVQMARTRSLTILPIEAFATVPGGLAEALIFGSGRPVVLFAHGQRLRKLGAKAGFERGQQGGGHFAQVHFRGDVGNGGGGVHGANPVGRRWCQFTATGCAPAVDCASVCT